MFLAGPRPQVDTEVRTPTLPDDVDAYVTAAEARVTDLRPDCGRRIVRVDPTQRVKTPVAIVYLHGFSATRQETAPLAERLAKSLGANLYEARLRGHGRSEDAMAEGSASAWLRDGVEALAIGRRLGEHVLVIGCSTGATLALWLMANGHGEGLLGAVLISPNFGVCDGRAVILTWPWGRQLSRLVAGEYRSFEPINERQAAYWTTRYPSEALVEMRALVDAANDCELAAVGTPTLVVYSPKDKVVDSILTEERFGRIGADRKKLWLFTAATDPSQHVLAGDVLSPASTDVMAAGIVELVAPLCSPKPGR